MIHLKMILKMDIELNKGKELCIISHGHILNKIYQIASLNKKIKKKLI